MLQTGRQRRVLRSVLRFHGLSDTPLGFSGWCLGQLHEVGQIQQKQIALREC